LHPTWVTACPAQLNPTGAASSNLEGAQGEKRAEYAENPESGRYLRFGPALELEVVMQWRSQKHTIPLRVLQAVLPAPVLEHRALENHRNGFRNEYSAYEEEQKLALQQQRYHPKRPA